MKQVIFVLFLIPLFLTGGIVNKVGAADEAFNFIEAGEEPDRVEVQHILISFKGAIPDDKVTRTQGEAEALAKDLFERAKAKEDFDELVKEYTDDQHPGIYRMSNIGISPDTTNKEYPREKMVKAFGDISFSLKMGEVGLAHYDPTTSKYGWHIIKRLK
ncbi:peptidylprolyl isomerase [Acidobacteriota bacterium]